MLLVHQMKPFYHVSFIIICHTCLHASFRHYLLHVLGQIWTVFQCFSHICLISPSIRIRFILSCFVMNSSECLSRVIKMLFVCVILIRSDLDILNIFLDQRLMSRAQPVQLVLMNLEDLLLTYLPSHQT